MCRLLNDWYENTKSTAEEFTSLMREVDNQETQWLPCTVGKMEAGVINLFEEDELKFVSEAGAQNTSTCGTGLYIRIGSLKYPLRDTAIQSILGRAGISGRTLKVLMDSNKHDLCEIINKCLACYPETEAKALYRAEKISAIHSNEYAVLPITQLLEVVEDVLNDRFPGWRFESGAFTHSNVRVCYSFPGQTDELCKPYIERLRATGKSTFADALIPGIVFNSSDTAASAVKVSAYLFGGKVPIAVGCAECLVHKGKKTPSDFADKVNYLFANYEASLEKLEKLLDIPIANPVECLTNICKEFCLPKAQSLSAIDLYKSTFSGPQTAHDIYTALQEVLFNCEVDKLSVERLFSVEENISKVVQINHWSDFDRATCEW